MTQTSAEAARAALPNYPAVTPQNLTAWVEERLKRVQQAIDRVTTAGPRTLETTLRAYDDAVAELSLAGSQTGLMHSVCPDKAVRDASEGLLQQISQVAVALSLNRDVYQALAAIDSSTARSSSTALPASTKTTPPAPA